MMQIDSDALAENAEKAARLLKAMANERRLMVLCNLVEGEQSVGSLERAIGISQSALSQHLARLRDDRLVKTRRDGAVIYYSLAGTEAAHVMRALYDLYCGGMDGSST